MRTLNVVFEDEEYEDMERIKDQEGYNWHDLIITKVTGKKKARDEKKEK